MARWLAWFQTHGVDAPLPGEAAVFCARVDSARMRLASALAKRRELAALEADRAALPECVRSLLSEAFYSGDDDIRPPRRRGTRWICVVRPIGCATSGDAWKSRFRP